MMPTTNMSSPPGMHMPIMPAIAPIAPRNFSPTSTAMLVAFSPGRLWLMESISTNSLSLIHCRLMTRLLRRYGTTPPKLVAPMIRNSRKIWKTETSAGVLMAPAMVCNPGFASVSLMALGLVSVESVHHAGLGDAQRQPVRHIVLQGYVEHGCQLLLLLSNTFSAIELHLEGELAHQRFMLAARAPQPDVAFGEQPFAEVQLTKRKQHLFHNAPVHQGQFLVSHLLQFGERREHFHQGGHRHLVGVVHLAQSELAIVRIQDAIPANLVLQRQRFGFELDPVLTGDLGTHIHRRGSLLIGMPELEHDFRVAHRKSVHVRDAPAQDERVVVKPEVGSVTESDFPDLRPQAGFRVRDEPDANFLRRFLHQLAEIPKCLHRRETVRFQDQLGFEVGHPVQRRTVGIALSRLRSLRNRLLRRRFLALNLALFALVFLLLVLRFLVFLSHRELLNHAKLLAGELHRMLNKYGSDTENSTVEPIEGTHTSLGNHSCLVHY